MPVDNIQKSKKDSKPRKVKQARYASFKLQKRVKPSEPALSSGFALMKQSVKLLVKNWKPILGLVAIYAIINIILVQSFSGFHFTQTKEALSEVFTGDWGKVLGSLSLFAFLLGGVGNTNSEAAGAYQFMLVTIMSLATIWMLRQLIIGEKVRVRDGFYKGMYPLIPFVLIFIVAVIQTLPVVLGAFLYGLAGPLSGFTNGVEWMLWLIALLLLAVLSLYMLSSSLIALYAVSLPGVEPRMALRAANKFVQFRRWAVMRKILFLPFILILMAAIIIIPVIMFVTPLTGILFFILTLIALPLVHAYMFALYQELIRENT